MDSGSSTKYIGQYEIAKTLGTGGCGKVKLGYDTSNGGMKCAVKILSEQMAQDDKEMLLNEINVMTQLNHQNIVRYLSHGTKEYTKPNGKSKMVDYIAMEICEHGELFDFVANSGSFSENVTRFYFK